MDASFLQMHLSAGVCDVWPKRLLLEEWKLIKQAVLIIRRQGASQIAVKAIKRAVDVVLDGQSCDVKSLAFSGGVQEFLVVFSNPGSKPQSSTSVVIGAEVVTLEETELLHHHEKALIEVLQERLSKKPRLAALSEEDKFSPIDILMRPEICKGTPPILEKIVETANSSFIEMCKEISVTDPLLGRWRKIGQRFEIFETSENRLILGKGAEGIVHFAREIANPSKFFACKRIVAVDAQSTEEYGTLSLLQRAGRSKRIVRHEEYVPPANHEREGFLFLELAVIDLHKFIEKGGAFLSPDGCRFLLRRMGKALADVHSCGFVHRDVRPPNFLLFRRGEVKLSDFGFARPFNTLHSLTVSKPSNLQPYEVCSCKNGQGVPKRPKCDVFQLGISFFFVASNGLYPFGNNTIEAQGKAIEARSACSRLTQIIKDPFLAHLLEHMLDHDESKRYGLKDVMSHPYFWSHERREAFIRDLWESDDKRVRVEGVITSMFSDRLCNWVTELGPVAQLLRPGKDVLKESFHGLVTCIRHGLTHAAEWRTGKSQVGSPEDQQTALNFMIKSGAVRSYLSEFWFTHPAIAWVVPCCYHALIQIERQQKEDRRNFGKRK